MSERLEPPVQVLSLLRIKDELAEGGEANLKAVLRQNTVSTDRYAGRAHPCPTCPFWASRSWCPSAPTSSSCRASPATVLERADTPAS